MATSFKNKKVKKKIQNQNYFMRFLTIKLIYLPWIILFIFFLYKITYKWHFIQVFKFVHKLYIFIVLFYDLYTLISHLIGLFSTRRDISRLYFL